MSLYQKVYQKINDNLIQERGTSVKEMYWCLIVFSFVSFYMTVVNIFTNKHFLTLATGLFCVICVVNIVCLKYSQKLFNTISNCFIVETLLLFTYFLVSGSPDGFSVIWICILPMCSYLVFGHRKGTIISVIMLGILIILLQTPLSNVILQYDYSNTFKMRFPLLYFAFLLVSYILEIIREVTYREMDKMRKKYQFLSFHDGLTKAYNRMGFNQQMDLIASKHEYQKLGFMIIDIDKFKNVNDTYGHLAGDQVLSSLAQTMREFYPNGKVCRWGGEEFAILVVDSDVDDNKCDNLRKEIANCPIKTDVGGVNVTVSIGMVKAFNGDELKLNKLVYQADSSLYQAKDNGRNQVICKWYE